MPPLNRRHFLRLATAATATALAGPAIASGLDGRAAGQPVYPLTGQADAWQAFKVYDPERDPDAPFYRSRVRRAGRIAPLVATQAHPGLTPDVRAGSLVATYLALDGGDDLNRTRYQTASQRFVHVERSWQYQDVVVGWNSTGLVPNAALTDAAHRNGVLCLGTLFQPDRRMFDGSDLGLQDIAGRLVKLARYFGFDGYFVNFEAYSDSDAQRVQDLIETMRQVAARQGLTDFYIQYYNGFTDIGAVWPGPPHADGRPRAASALRADSMMLDQGWGNYGLTHGCCSGAPLGVLPSAANTASFPGISSVFYGMQLYPGPGYLGLMAPTVITPNGGPARGSLQIYSAEDGLRKTRNARLDTQRANGDDTARNEIAAFTSPATRRNAWYDLHRRFWSGQSGNPAHDNAPTIDQLSVYGAASAHKIYTDYEAPQIKPTDQLRLPITYGVANFISERSAIAASPFVTCFNTGEGDRFWMDGILMSDAAWFNLGCQDVLPTWSWWTRAIHQEEAGAPGLTIGYDYERAFDGGTSLRIDVASGVSTNTEVRLYKTDLPITSTTEIGLAVGDMPVAGLIRVGLTFSDAPNDVVWLSVDPAQSHAEVGAWTPWAHSLAVFSGRRLACISLGFKGSSAAYGVNVGKLWIGSPPCHASRPTGRLRDPALDRFRRWAVCVLTAFMGFGPTGEALRSRRPSCRRNPTVAWPYQRRCLLRRPVAEAHRRGNHNTAPHPLRWLGEFRRACRRGLALDMKLSGLVRYSNMGRTGHYGFEGNRAFAVSTWRKRPRSTTAAFIGTTVSLNAWAVTSSKIF